MVSLITGLAARNLQLSLCEDASEDELGKLRNQALRLQFAFGLVPLINPVDHAEQREGRGARAHFAAERARFFLNL